jgi:hypothetical protein
MEQMEKKNKFDHDRTIGGIPIWWIVVPVAIIALTFFMILNDGNTGQPVDVPPVALNAPVVVLTAEATLSPAQQSAVNAAVEGTAAVNATLTAFAPWASVGQ